MRPVLPRRAALSALAWAALASGCGRGCGGAPSASRDVAAGSLASPGWLDLAFADDAGVEGGERALVLVPDANAAAERPVLVALHGRGEANRGLAAGARGWRDDYHLERAHRALLSPPLDAADFGGMVEPERLRRVNASLASDAYAGCIVACPYTPDLPDRTASGAAGFARFVIHGLLPRVRAETGAKAERSRTGIDGVSMGGRLALLVGLTHPETFGAVGALQPAIRPDEAEALSKLARSAMDRAPIALRLVSSDGDPFLPAVRALSERLRADGVAHELLEVPGPHDYAWNRGPGGIEMLVWHERVLSGRPPP